MKRVTCGKTREFLRYLELYRSRIVGWIVKFAPERLTTVQGFRKEWLSTMEFGWMARKGKKESAPAQPKRIAQSSTHRPEWSDGLRKLYDSVVEEPLPDSFDDLLKKLDQASGH